MRAKVMMHFLGEHDINLPYFQLSSLRKMCSIVQRNPRNIEPHLYHHGLVKILVEEQLKAKRDTWERFLIRNHFQEIGEASVGSHQVPKRSRRRRREEITPEVDVQLETAVHETVVPETVQEPIEEEIAAHHSEHENDPEPAINIDQVAQEMISETLQEIVKEAAQKKKETKKKQKLDKGKAIAQETELTPEIYITPENSSEEDTQPLASSLAQLHEASLSKKLQKQRQKKQKEKQSITSLRRSSRLQSKEGTTKGRESLFIDLSTPEKGAKKLDFEESPLHVEHVETSPPREESLFEQEPEFEQKPEYEHEPSSKRSPEVDPDQQKVYNYLEMLEQAAAGPSTILPFEQQVHSLKQEVLSLKC